MLAKIQYKVLPFAKEDMFEIENSILLPILTTDIKNQNEKTWFIKDNKVVGTPVICRIASTKDMGKTYKPYVELQGVLIKGNNGGNYLIPKENIKKK